MALHTWSDRSIPYHKNTSLHSISLKSMPDALTTHSAKHMSYHYNLNHIMVEKSWYTTKVVIQIHNDLYTFWKHTHHDWLDNSKLMAACFFLIHQFQFIKVKTFTMRWHKKEVLIVELFSCRMVIRPLISSATVIVGSYKVNLPRWQVQNLPKLRLTSLPMKSIIWVELFAIKNAKMIN